MNDPSIKLSRFTVISSSSCPQRTVRSASLHIRTMGQSGWTCRRASGSSSPLACTHHDACRPHPDGFSRRQSPSVPARPTSIPVAIAGSAWCQTAFSRLLDSIARLRYHAAFSRSSFPFLPRSRQRYFSALSLQNPRNSSGVAAASIASIHSIPPAL